MKPMAVDLFCGLGGWTEGLLAEGYAVTGYDIEAHEYGGDRYPGKLDAEWFDRNLCALSSKSSARKAASAQIAKIPFALSSWIARTYQVRLDARAMRGD